MRLLDRWKPEHPLTRQLGLLLLALVAILPAVLLSSIHVTSPFLYYNLAYGEASKSNGELGAEELGLYAPDVSPGYSTMLIELSLVLGLGLETIRYLPAGAAFLGAAMFAAYRSWTGSAVIAGLGILYFLTDPSLGLGVYSVFAYSWSMPLYIVFLTTYLQFLVDRSRARFAALVLLFAGVTYIHYTAPVWMMIGVAVGGFLSHFWKDTRPGRTPAAASAYLLAACSVIYLGFNKVLYGLVLVRESENLLGDTYGIFAARVSRTLGVAPAAAPEAYLYSAGEDPLVNLLTSSQYLLFLIGFAAATLILLNLIQTGADRRALFLPVLLVGVGIATTAMDVVSYSLQGVVSLKYVLLAYPLLVPLAFLQLPGVPRPRVLATLFLGALLLIGGAKFALLIQNPSGLPELLDGNDFRHVVEGNAWLLEHLSEDGRVLADLHTAGKLYLSAAKVEDRFTPIYFNSKNYDSVVTGSTPPIRFDVVLVNLKTLDAPVKSLGWRFYEPFEQHTDEMDGNTRMHAVFDDGSLRAYRFDYGNPERG